MSTSNPAPSDKSDLDAMIAYGDKLADWMNRAGPALAALLAAYERRIRSECTPEQLAAEPWRCAEFIEGERVLADKPANVLTVEVPFKCAKALPSKQCQKCGHRILTDERGELVPHMTGSIDRGGQPCGDYTYRDVANVAYDVVIAATQACFMSVEDVKSAAPLDNSTPDTPSSAPA